MMGGNALAEVSVIVGAALAGYVLGVMTTLVAIGIGHWIAKTDISTPVPEKKKEEGYL